MAWIEVHQHLKEHRKTRKFKNLMGITRAQAIGHLIMLWLWGIDNTDDCGIIMDADYDDIAIACDYHEDSQLIVSALITSGFLEKDEKEGKLFIHDFEDYIGKLKEQKKRHREAQKRYSERLKVNENDNQHDCQADDHAIANLTVPYRTLPYLTVPSPNKDIIILLPDESDLISTLEQIKDYPLDRTKDLKMYKELQKRYPTIDILGSIKDWSFGKLDKPLESNSNPRLQINTWIGKGLKWGKNLKQVGNNDPVSKTSPSKYDNFYL